ncbi:glycoside hydrolase family 5 protein [Paenibacillus sp. MWE-103]|uniref:Glycoside hydrolase family 5 protein n=1 Tax=Paenibacillus artemisiicola TaxID=1172618 RepID=A0ABS3W5N6_9BACL|nr:glycoside hydrolase family 5 protein [Paenibacillus artemisiicola]MBO7743622.1 glycoside hydrolase family 5 protein [Paenibacillus artemisiicola]
MKLRTIALAVSLLAFVLAAGCKGNAQTHEKEAADKAEPVAKAEAANDAEKRPPSPHPEPAPAPAASSQAAPDPKLPKRAPQSAPLDVFQQANQLGRGVNLGNALEAPTEGEWGVTLQESYFKTIKDAGFETVRVPIKWSGHADAKAPYAIDAGFFDRIDWVIGQALKQGLNVVLDMHNYDELYLDSVEQEPRFLALWKQISARYKELPGNVYFELLNEPNGSLTWSKWNRLLKKTLDAIRSEDPWHTVMIGSVNWSNFADLASLDIPDNERNVIVTFHYYDPFPFTHQGAEWAGPEIGTVGVEWPGPPSRKVEPIAAAKQVKWVDDWFRDYNANPAETNPASPRSIAEAFDKADNWAKEHHRPIYLGEFGAYSKADMPSRARWTAAVREEAEKRGFGWAYWEFCAGFGVYDPAANQYRQELLDALVPPNQAH